MVQCGHKDSCKWAQEAEERDPETTAGRISPCLKVVGVRAGGAAPLPSHLAGQKGCTSILKGRTPTGIHASTQAGGEWVPDSRQAPPQEERPAGMSAPGNWGWRQEGNMVCRGQ